MESLGCSGGSRNHRQRRSASPAQIFVGKIQNHLIVCVGVNGRHRAALDREIVVYNFRKRSQAVRRTRGIGNDVMFRRIVLSFTPNTMVISSFFAGAEMMTFFTPPRKCFRAASASVNLPVDSTTICAPTDSQLRLAGSFSAKTLIFLLPMLIVPSVAVTFSLRLP